jgi:hypothetical protein
MSRELLAGLAGCELLDLCLELPNFSLLRFDRSDQQGRQSRVVYALNLVGLRVARDHLGHDLIHILSHHANFAFSIVLAVKPSTGECSPGGTTEFSRTLLSAAVTTLFRVRL